jgi:Putative peptidoglycan binding domain
MRWLTVAASLALACAPLAGAAPAAIAPQASSSSSSSSSSGTSSGSSSAKHKKTSKKHHSQRRGPTQKAPTADRISEIQSALAREGYYTAEPNGKWDATTIAATERFQAAHGMDATGKLDATTLQKLGLGSDTAGVSAPKPLMPNCCAASTTPPPAEDKPAAPCCSTTPSTQTQSSNPPAATSASTVLDQGSGAPAGSKSNQR